LTILWNQAAQRRLANGHVSGFDLLEIVRDDRAERIAYGGHRFVEVGHGLFLRM
jgi:hypothetical protein